MVRGGELRVEDRLVLGEDRIECDVLRYALERDMWDGLVDQPPGQPLRLVAKFVIVIFGREQSLAGDGDRYTACVGRNPPAAPLLGHERGRSRPAGGIEYEVAGIG